MESVVIDPARPPSPADLATLVIIEEVRAGGTSGPSGKRLFRKGHRLAAADRDALATAGRPIRAVRLSPGEVHEDDAGVQLAAAIAGPGVACRPPVQSRVNLIAATKGLLRIDAAAVADLNRLPGVAVFTLLDRLPVLPGKILAGAKIIPVAVPRDILDDAVAIAGRAPVVQVKPFRPLKIGVIATDGLDEKARERFQTTLRKKIAWYGGDVLGFVDIADDADEVAAAMRAFLDQGADLLMTGGGNTMDPDDAALRALGALGGEVVKAGAPAHPGSMFWLAELGETPVFNVASCSMYSKSTVADLVLPWIMAGERVTLTDMAMLGYGGLLDRDMGYRFPPYDAEAANEPDES